MDFNQLIKKEKNGRMRIRLLALAHFSDGLSRTEIAVMLKVSRTSVNKWVSDYLNEGLEGLVEKTLSGRPSKLLPKQQLQLRQYIEQQSENGEGGRLILADIQLYIMNTFDVQYELSAVHRLLKSLDFSWITSRSKHPKQSIEAQDSFKKFPTGNDPSHTRTHLTRSR